MKLTPEQEAAVTATGRRIVVAAGAGSGKTRVLVQRIAALLEKGVDLDEIAAITFTEKAAAEMKARLREEFRKRARVNDFESMTLWRDFERRLDSARISTIHSFCMRLLKENALYLELPPDFALLSEGQSRLLQRDTVRETLRRLLLQEDPAILRLARERTFRELTALFMALVPRLHHLARLSSEWPLQDPAALAAQWREQANRALLEEAQSHGWRLRLELLRRQLQHFEGQCTDPDDGREQRRIFLLEQLDCLLSATPDDQCLSQVCRRVSTFRPTKNGAKKNWPSEADYQRLEKLQEEARATITELCSLPECSEESELDCAEATAALLQVCAALHKDLTKVKRDRAVLDFDDLILETQQVLEADPALACRAARDIRHLLIDEFQDTDHVQLSIAESLCNAGEGPSLFVVGDAKQSIYRFRGAEVEVFHQVRQGQGALPLAQNFRSASGILHFVNHFFAESGYLGAVEPDFTPLRPHRPGAEDACVEFLLSPMGETLKDNARDARKREAVLIARRIQALCNGPELIWVEATKTFRAPRPGDFAILLRALSNVHLYTEALAGAGIEFGVVAGNDFFERQEVLDVLNLAKVMLDPFDEPALLAVLRSPFCALRDDTLALLCRHKPLPLAFFSSDSPEGILDPDALADARAFMTNMQRHAEGTSAAFLQRVLEETHYEAALLPLPGGIQRASNLRKLADIAADFTAGGEPSLRRFTTYLDDMRSAIVREGDAMLQPQETGAVTIMSVHKSKGLEFPVVILADAAGEQGDPRRGGVLHHNALGAVLTTPDEDGQSRPALWAEVIKRRNEREEMDEHLRLLYVGLTRPKDYLIISGGGKPRPKSWLSLLDHTYGIMAQSHGGTLQGEGWRARICHEVPESLPLAPRPQPGQADWDAVFARVEQPLPPQPPAESISVSQLLNQMQAGLGDEEDREQPYDQQEPDPFVLTRGSLVHRLFELWDFTQPAPINAILRETAARPDKKQELQQDLQDIATKFQELSLFDTLRQAQQLVREQPFVLRVANRLLRGTIDALLDGHTIIDYKTGAPNPAKQQRYQWQLQLYAAAVHALTGALPHKGLIIYVEHGIVDEVPITPASAQAALDEAARLLA